MSPPRWTCGRAEFSTRENRAGTGMVDTEADTCRRYVLPKLREAGWTDDQINEQRSFTDGRIVVSGRKGVRGKRKRVDYLLRYRRDVPIAVVEAKSEYRHPADGLGQAKD